MLRLPLATVLSTVALLAACSAEPDPEPTTLRDAIQAPQDKARATEAEILEAAENRRAKELEGEK